MSDRVRNREREIAIECLPTVHSARVPLSKAVTERVEADGQSTNPRVWSLVTWTASMEGVLMEASLLAACSRRFVNIKHPVHSHADNKLCYRTR